MWLALSVAQGKATTATRTHCWRQGWHGLGCDLFGQCEFTELLEHVFTYTLPRSYEPLSLT